MSSVSSYILTIAGIILISVVVELVMSEGAMSKYIKSIFSFFVIAVIIAPLPTLISSKEVSSIFEYSDYELQEGYIYTLNESRLKTMATDEERLLREEGYSGIDIVLFSDNMAEAEVVISRISVNLVSLVIDERAEHKNKSEIKVYLAQRYMDKYELKEEGIIYEG